MRRLFACMRSLRLMRNWRDVLTRAWSVRFTVLAAVFSALEVAWPLLDGHVPVPPRTFAVLSGLFAAGGFASRIIVQNNLPEA